MTSLYSELKIWKRKGEGVVVLYRCFQSLAGGKFAVQSADFFKLPVDIERLQQSEKQFLELLLEVPPSERCDWFDSLEEAIAAHDNEFS